MAEAEKHLFISGMARSGTTWLQQLLNNHHEMEVLDQPLPLLFIDAKKRFLNVFDEGHQVFQALNKMLDHL